MTDKSMEDDASSGDETCSMDLGAIAPNQGVQARKVTAFSDLRKLQTEIVQKLKKRSEKTQNEFQ